MIFTMEQLKMKCSFLKLYQWTMGSIYQSISSILLPAIGTRLIEFFLLFCDDFLDSCTKGADAICKLVLGFLVSRVKRHTRQTRVPDEKKKKKNAKNVEKRGKVGKTKWKLTKDLKAWSNPKHE